MGFLLKVFLNFIFVRFVWTAYLRKTLDILKRSLENVKTNFRIIEHGVKCILGVYEAEGEEIVLDLLSYIRRDAKEGLRAVGEARRNLRQLVEEFLSN